MGYSRHGVLGTEDTLGAADLVSFREEAGGAALPRQSAQAGCRGRIPEISTGSQAHRVVLARPLSHAGRGERDMRCPSSERVGAKPPPRAIATRGCLGSGREPAANQGPLTQEDSTLRSSSCLAHAGVHGEPPQTTLAMEGAAKAASNVRRRVSKVRRPCLRIANDGRSRRTAHGLKRARVMNLRKRAGLARNPLAGRRGESASEAGPRRQSRCPVAGPRSRFRVKARRRAGIRRWKAPWRGGIRCL